jgi:hypothetical protein
MIMVSGQSMRVVGNPWQAGSKRWQGVGIDEAVKTAALKLRQSLLPRI